MAKTKRKILVVDDEKIIVQFLRNLLHAEYDIQTAERGEDAIRQAHDWRPHVLILDINIPDVDGFEVCRQVKDDEGCQHTVVLAMTSDPTPERIARIREAGATQCLQKPFALMDFLALVQRYSHEACEREMTQAT